MHYRNKELVKITLIMLYRKKGVVKLPLPSYIGKRKWLKLPLLSYLGTIGMRFSFFFANIYLFEFCPVNI